MALTHVHASVRTQTFATQPGTRLKEAPARWLMCGIVQAACSCFQQRPLRTPNTHLSEMQPSEISIA